MKSRSRGSEPENLGGASHIGNAFVGGADDAEGLFLIQAFSDHLFVARLKNVQRERDAWEQDEVERK